MHSAERCINEAGMIVHLSEKVSQSGTWLVLEDIF